MENKNPDNQLPNNPLDEIATDIRFWSIIYNSGIDLTPQYQQGNVSDTGQVSQGTPKHLPTQFLDQLNKILANPEEFGSQRIKSKLEHMAQEVFIDFVPFVRPSIIKYNEDTNKGYCNIFNIIISRDYFDPAVISSADIYASGIALQKNILLDSLDLYNIGKEMERFNSRPTHILEISIPPGIMLSLKDDVFRQNILHFNGLSEGGNYSCCAYRNEIYVQKNDKIMEILAGEAFLEFLEQGSKKYKPIKDSQLFKFGSELFNENYTCRIQHNKGPLWLPYFLRQPTTDLTNLGPNNVILNFVDKESRLELYFKTRKNTKMRGIREN